VVLNIGEADQLVPGVQMLVFRDNILLGKVKIRTVERKTSIADIIAVTQAGISKEKKISIMPGDMVIF